MRFGDYYVHMFLYFRTSSAALSNLSTRVSAVTILIWIVSILGHLHPASPNAFRRHGFLFQELCIGLTPSSGSPEAGLTHTIC